MSAAEGRLVDIGDTALHVVERGAGPAVIALHGGPGLDHHWFADYLDPLAADFRLLLVDMRGHGRSAPSEPATWSLAQLAADMGALARALALERYGLLGHSFGAFVALQQAVENARAEVATIVSGGVPSARWLPDVDAALASVHPPELRARLAAAWQGETRVQDDVDLARIVHAQLPFHFADPEDPRIAEYRARTAATVYAPAAMRHFAARDYGNIDVEHRLGDVRGPLLVLGGRHDRTCAPAAAEVIARGAPGAELTILGRSGHMAFVEEPAAYLAAVRSFLARHFGAAQKTGVSR